MEIIKHFERHDAALPLEPPDADTLHLWRLELPPVERVAGAVNLADVFEARRHPHTDRESALAERGLIRILLAGYLEADPLEMLLNSDREGAFVLHAGRRMRFSPSRSDGLLLVAITAQVPAHLAMERGRHDLPFEDLARTYLNPGQTWEILTAPPTDRATRFLRHWTRNEAGSPLPAGTPCTTWDVEPEQNCIAALVIEGSDWNLECFDGHFSAPSTSPILADAA